MLLKADPIACSMTDIEQVAKGDDGKGMVHGEYESMKAIMKYRPEFVPHPIAWGTFSSYPNMHFMVSEFREMNRQVPDMEETCSAISKMHLDSHSAGMKQFGFPITTYNGRLAQNNQWCDSWEMFYVQQLKDMLILEEQAQGLRTEEMQQLLQQIFDKVIPRLLRPMETTGHKITPTLVHGDFWHGNVSTDLDTGRPVTYDAGAFWGHNEYDIRTMTTRARFKFGPAWQREYLKHYPAAFPQEDFEARSELYIFRSEVHDAALFPNDTNFRKTLIEHARTLVDAYGEGYETWMAASNKNI